MGDRATDGRNVRARMKTKRPKAAVALRLAGAPFGDIAETLGYSDAGQARMAIERELATAAEDQEGRDRLRAEASARLERLMRSVWPKAVDASDPEHLPAIRVALGLIDRHIKLHGLDAPTEVVVHTPTTAEIDTWVAEMLHQRAGGHVVEGEVIVDAIGELEGAG